MSFFSFLSWRITADLPLRASNSASDVNENHDHRLSFRLTTLSRLTAFCAFCDPAEQTKKPVLANSCEFQRTGFIPAVSPLLGSGQEPSHEHANTRPASNAGSRSGYSAFSAFPLSPQRTICQPATAGFTPSPALCERLC